MPVKLDISYKGKTYHIDAEGSALMGKKIGDTVEGADILSGLSGSQFLITGASDKSGLPSSVKVEGTGLKRVLLKKGFGFHTRHKKKKTSNNKVVKGMRIRRSQRGSTLSEDISQVNLKMLKEGSKPLAAMLGKEDKPKAEAAAAAPAEEQK